MTIEDLKKIQPIPGFDCVKMKHDIQAKIYEETKDMTWESRRAYFESESDALRLREATQVMESDSFVLREEPPRYDSKSE